jgi:filamentous hemagglutinin family protein
VSKALSPWFSISLCTLSYLCATNNPASAQVTSDGTLNTQVTENGNTAEISGGETRGDNLFHSFQNFSVKTGNEAFFNNADIISNIFSRVTGGNISDIDGAIRANGSANLFLINPAGIIFGEGASLNIGGSFYGSSASSILFEDGEFSAVDLENPPLLTVNAPIGLGFRDNPGDIVNRSIAQNPNGETNVNDGNVGLQVPNGETLAIAGGNVLLDDGNLTAKGGQIEIGSVLGEGKIGLLKTNIGFILDYDSVNSFGDITLKDTAVVDVTASGGGDIVINARNINIENNSSLNAGILSDVASDSSRFPDGQAGTSKDDNLQAGNIIINARNLNVNSSTISNSVFGKGKGGDLRIATKNLVVQDGGSISINILGEGNAGNSTINVENFTVQNSQVSASTFGKGNAGSLIVNASNSVELSGETPFGTPGGLFAQVNPDGQGDGGNLTIDTKSLSVSDGSKVQVSTFGIGKSGDLTIRASDIDVFETSIDNFFSTGIFAETSLASTPNSSDLSVKGIGNAGNLTIETERLRIKDGGQVSASTYGFGDAGTLTVKAIDSIEVSGIEDANAFGGSKGGFRSVSFLAAEVIEEATGKGGNLNIETGLLKIVNQGKISVSTLNESGTAGNLDINANSIQLDRGSITAVTSFGEDGNINLKINDILRMRDNSLISAQAFNEANGGNLNIDSRFIVAYPDGNNDILANAEQGTGGNININAESLLGIKERTLSITTNDINASSKFNLDGTTKINTSDVNPIQGAIELPSNVVEPTQTAAQTCSANREGKANNGLAIAGRGGVSPTPDNPLNSENISNQNPAQATIPEPLETSQGKIQPAMGIKVTESGKIVLTAYRTNNAGERIPEIQPSCN